MPISTERHVLQDWVDLADVKWDAANKKLSSVAKVIGGEAFRIVLAGNGRKARYASADDAQVRLDKHPAGEGFTMMVIERKENGPTN